MGPPRKGGLSLRLIEAFATQLDGQVGTGREGHTHLREISIAPCKTAYALERYSIASLKRITDA